MNARAKKAGALPGVVPLRVLGVASEMFPLLKTGGLADVVGALPAALAPLGVEVRTLLPGHPSVIGAMKDARELCQWPDWFGGAARLLAARHGELELLVLDAPHLYLRHGNPYLDSTGRDWPDNPVRYAALAHAAARIGWGEVTSFAPDLLHMHDWQAALVPAYLHYLGADKRRPATVLTLHNLAFQGQFKAEVWSRLGLPAEAFAMQGLEYHGDIGYLKAGIHFADAITTVSPTYAREIRTLSGGMGLDPMLRWRDSAVSGIVNGIDTEVWNPATDARLAQSYTADDLSGREPNTREIEQRLGLPASNTPLLCMVSRLTAQKGIDLVAATLDAIVASGAAGHPGQRRSIARGGAARRREAPPRAGGGAHRLRRGAVAPAARWQRRDPGALALRALRPDPAVRPALRLRAGGGARRRPGRHRDRRQRRGAEGRRGHRRAVRRQQKSSWAYSAPVIRHQN